MSTQMTKLSLINKKKKKTQEWPNLKIKRKLKINFVKKLKKCFKKIKNFVFLKKKKKKLILFFLK
jgi:hypothetical protein